MKLEKTIDKEVFISVSVEELETISNALNEVCNALDLDEFQTRMGVTLDEAQALLARISAVFLEI